MPTLADILLTPPRHEAFVADMLKLIDDHVAERHGLRGMMLKTGLGTLKATRPDLLPRAVERLLPDFFAAIEPLHVQCTSTPGCDFATYLPKHDTEAGAMLMAAADRRIAESQSTTVHAYYKRFRGMAAEEVRIAMPAMAALIGRHLEA